MFLQYSEQFFGINPSALCLVTERVEVLPSAFLWSSKAMGKGYPLV
jgi:hypothetical protein